MAPTCNLRTLRSLRGERPARPPLRLRSLGTLPACLLAAPLVLAAPADKLYDLTIETGMPHLEENLRYATRHERRCVDTRDLSAVFPVLRDVSLQDCELVDAVAGDTGVAYTLRCTAGHGTTGEAVWQLEEGRITGMLKVKLGGKNMTFYQRITGRPVGTCQPDPGSR